MIRLTLLSLFVLFLWAYAFRNWMVSLCGLILLTFAMQRNDMPSQIAGITGLNPWNVTLAVVTLAWFQQRRGERKPWNLSWLSIVIVGGYIGIIVLAYVQALASVNAFPADFQSNLLQFLTVDHLINPLKFIWVALLLADGCHSKRRLTMALGTLVGLGILYAIMVIRIMPLEALQEGVEATRYRWRIDKQIGLGVNDLAKLLTLTFWSILATQRLWWQTWWSKVGGLTAYAVTFLSVALCYSRAAYLTFVAVGFVLGCIRWRMLLWLGLPVLLLLGMLMPSVTQRISMGFDQGGEEGVDWNEVTAGRTGNLWPPIVEEIWKAPLFGHGRLAIVHTPAYDKILDSEGVVPTTPHSGYLEVMVDTGALGMITVLAVFVGTGILSYRLMRQRQQSLLVALGALGLVHALGCLVNALSGGTLLPNQAMLGTMCAFGIVLRVWSGRVGATRLTSPTQRDAWWCLPSVVSSHLRAPSHIPVDRRSGGSPDHLMS